MGDAFHQATVSQEHIGEMVHHLVPWPIELGGQYLLTERHTNSIGNTLTQRTGGGFYSRCITVFWVTRRTRMQLAKILELFNGQVISGKMEECVMQHGSMPVGQNESVPVRPTGVSGVMPQIIRPQHLGDVRHAHRHTGMPASGLLNRVHAERAHCIRPTPPVRC